jgi:hypothetical protein
MIVNSASTPDMVIHIFVLDYKNGQKNRHNT